MLIAINSIIFHAIKFNRFLFYFTAKNYNITVKKIKCYRVASQFVVLLIYAYGFY